MAKTQTTKRTGQRSQPVKKLLDWFLRIWGERDGCSVARQARVSLKLAARKQWTLDQWYKAADDLRGAFEDRFGEPPDAPAIIQRVRMQTAETLLDTFIQDTQDNDCRKSWSKTFLAATQRELRRLHVDIDRRQTTACTLLDITDLGTAGGTAVWSKPRKARR